jgi:hypothetical protein
MAILCFVSRVREGRWHCTAHGQVCQRKRYGLMAWTICHLRPAGPGQSETDEDLIQYRSGRAFWPAPTCNSSPSCAGPIPRSFSGAPTSIAVGDLALIAAQIGLPDARVIPQFRRCSFHLDNARFQH